MKENLHVLVIPTWYPNGRDKLIGIYHKTFCKVLAETGKAKVNMLYIDRVGIKQLPQYPFMKKRYEEKGEGYTVYAHKMLSRVKVSFKWQAKVYAKVMEKAFRAYVKKEGKPDVLHAHVAVPAGYAAARIGKKYGIPVLVTEHAYSPWAKPEGKEFSRFVAQNAKVTCVSTYLQNMLREKYGTESELLYNVVDTAAFEKPRALQNDGVYRLLTVSALRPGKCVDDTIKALKLLRDRGEIGNFEFTVIGDGQTEAFYKQAAIDLQMTDCVKFVGRKTPAEAAEYLTHTDTLVLASNFETFGIPALEALAAGVPVVCTRCYGPETFLDSTCAEMCEFENPEDLARAIKAMYERKGTFDENALRAVAKNFGSEAIANRAFALYEELLQK